MQRIPTSLRPVRRAFALVASLGMLTLLSLIASTFVLLAGVEEDTARNHVASVRALMLAQSGIETSIAVLTRGDPKARPWGGEDWNGGGEPAGTPDGTLDDFHGDGNGRVEVAGCALRYARRPSLWRDDDGDGLPDLIPVMEAGSVRLRGISGRMGGTYHAGGDTFVLRIEDTSGFVSINQTAAGYRNLYDNLGALVLSTPVPNLGSRIQAGQPYAALEDLVTKGALTVDQYRELQPYLTLHAWTDPSTIRPDPSPDATRRPSNLRKMDGLEPRAPINLNTADEIVIQACLLGISGYHFERVSPNNRLVVFGSRDAEDLARAIVAARSETGSDLDGNGRIDPGEPWDDRNGNGRYDGPFRTWEQFEAFLEDTPGLIRGGGGRGNRGPDWARSLVLANADPNSVLQALQPGPPLNRPVDKANLVRYTTEFCFESSGTYRISSLGRVTDARFRTVAEREIECEIRLYDTLRLTTQEDFESTRLASETGEDVMTLPEEVADLSPEPWRDDFRDGRFGFGDSFIDLDGDGAREGPAIYDGQIVLRPADPAADPPWGAPPSELAFRCLFNDSPSVSALGPGDEYPHLAADRASPGVARGLPLQSPPFSSSVERGASLLRDLTGAGDYSDLGPAGLLLREDTGECLYWSSILNWPIGAGSVQFWMRPFWQTEAGANQSKDLMTLNQQYALDPVRGRIALLSTVHFGRRPALFTMDSRAYTHANRTAATEAADDSGIPPPSVFHTHYQLKLDRDWVPDQWHHFAASYTDHIRWTCWLDSEPFRTVVEAPFPSSGRASLGNPSPTGNHMALGTQIPWSSTSGTGTYDDFVVYRATLPATTFGLAPAWRYGDTGIPGWSTWTMRIPLPPGARVRSFAWTERRPRVNYQGEPLCSGDPNPRRRRPDVHFSWRDGSGAWQDAPRAADPDEPDGGELRIGAGAASPQSPSAEVRFTFDRGGQEPFRNSPVVDDVTVTFARHGGVTFLHWRILP